MGKLIAAIDQGTTSTRCMIFNLRGEIVGASQREHRQIFPKAGWVEHDPDELYFVLSGTGAVVVDDRELPVAAGSTVFVPGGAWHSARNTGDDVLRILYVFPVDSFDDVVYEYRDGTPG